MFDRKLSDIGRTSISLDWLSNTKLVPLKCLQGRFLQCALQCVTWHCYGKGWPGVVYVMCILLYRLTIVSVENPSSLVELNHRRIWMESVAHNLSSKKTPR